MALGVNWWEGKWSGPEFIFSKILPLFSIHPTFFSIDAFVPHLAYLQRFFSSGAFSDTQRFRRAGFRKIATIYVREVGPFAIFGSCPSPHALRFCREAQRKGPSPNSDKHKNSDAYNAVQQVCRSKEPLYSRSAGVGKLKCKHGTLASRWVAG
jgi:hypothetical protein